MSKIVDVEEVQEALNRAATSDDRSGRFRLEAKMPRVQSPMIIAMHYNDNTSELDITFINGATYRYFDVPSEIYERLLDTESKGQFFNETVSSTFRYSKRA